MALIPSDRAFSNPPGANLFIETGADDHADRSTLGPRGNKVQAGALTLLGTHSKLGRPNHQNPLGAQDG